MLDECKGSTIDFLKPIFSESTYQNRAWQQRVVIWPLCVRNAREEHAYCSICRASRRQRVVCVQVKNMAGKLVELKFLLCYRLLLPLLDAPKVFLCFLLFV
jgi:hypothetical protein